MGLPLRRLVESELPKRRTDLGFQSLTVPLAILVTTSEIELGSRQTYRPMTTTTSGIEDEFHEIELSGGYSTHSSEAAKSYANTLQKVLDECRLDAKYSQILTKKKRCPPCYGRKLPTAKKRSIDFLLKG